MATSLWRGPIFSGLGGDNSASSIKAQRFSATGAKIGGEILVNTLTSGGQMDPAITASGPNGFLVAWTDTGTGGVQAQLFTLTSTDENTALALNVAAAVTDTDGSETLALVASSIPVGATLSDGVNSFTASAGQTSVNISTWTLANLTITPALNFTGDFQLTFTATTTDHATLSSGAVPTPDRFLRPLTSSSRRPPTPPYSPARTRILSAAPETTRCRVVQAMMS